MARIKLEVPSTLLSVIKIPLRISDINYGNHLGNDSFISITHEARVQWLRLHNFTELNIDGAGLILADLAIEFKAEGFYGDIVTVEICVGEITKIGFELYYSLKTERNNKPVLLGVAKTGIICYNYTEKRVCSLPGKLKDILSPNT
jgi:acyl-CoA thioester hydrolase